MSLKKFNVFPPNTVGKKAKLEEAMYEWGKGSVQKAETDAAIRNLEDMKDEPFARLADDPKLEKERKQVIYIFFFKKYICYLTLDIIFLFR